MELWKHTKEIIQTQKDKYYVIPLREEPRIGKLIDKVSRRGVT